MAHHHGLFPRTRLLGEWEADHVTDSSLLQPSPHVGAGLLRSFPRGRGGIALTLIARQDT